MGLFHKKTEKKLLPGQEPQPVDTLPEVPKNNKSDAFFKTILGNYIKGADLSKPDKQLAAQLQLMEKELPDGRIAIAITEENGRSFIRFMHVKDDGTFEFLAYEGQYKKSVADWLKEIIKNFV